MDWTGPEKTCQFACRSISAHNYQTQRVSCGSIVGFHRCSAIASFVSVPEAVYLDEVKCVKTQCLFESSVDSLPSTSDTIMTSVLTVQVAATKTSRLSVSTPARTFDGTLIPHPMSISNTLLIASTRNIAQSSSTAQHGCVFCMKRPPRPRNQLCSSPILYYCPTCTVYRLVTTLPALQSPSISITPDVAPSVEEQARRG